VRKVRCHNGAVEKWRAADISVGKLNGESPVECLFA
jgi:hypothetical protein